MSLNVIRAVYGDVSEDPAIDEDAPISLHAWLWTLSGINELARILDGLTGREVRDGLQYKPNGRAENMAIWTWPKPIALFESWLFDPPYMREMIRGFVQWKIGVRNHRLRATLVPFPQPLGAYLPAFADSEQRFSMWHGLSWGCAEDRWT